MGFWFWRTEEVKAPEEVVELTGCEGCCGCDCDEEPVEVDIDRLREEAKDHILFMLGAPVLKLELDEKQLTHALDHAIAMIDRAGFSDEEDYSLLLKEGSLAFAKYMLGRIRVKFLAASQFECPADGFVLVEEARRDIEAFRTHLGFD
jgi:hypothetical protein